MKPEDIHLYDWQRILTGTSPAGYYFEIILRVTFIYFLIVLSMRLMGKRMSSHLTRNELAALTSLAAAVGMPILSFEKGLLPALAVAIIVVVGQRTISTLSCIYPKFERATQGNITILLEDGTLHLQHLLRTRVSKDRLFSLLRENELTHLGQLERIYFEANGSFNLVMSKTHRPGLCIIPIADPDFRKELPWQQEQYVCADCGRQATPETKVCPHCQSHVFVHPVK